MSLPKRKAVERMADRDKVICDLKILRTWCAVDPIYGIGLTPRECEMAVGWIDDALALLKAQEPRLLTLDDVAAWVRQKPLDREPIYVEVKDLLGTWGAWMVDEIASYLPETDLSSELYGKTWRVWSAKPTDEQRKAVSWND